MVALASGSNCSAAGGSPDSICCNVVWEDGDFDGNGRVESADYLILAENFGKSRQGVLAPSLSATSQTLLAVTISAADDLFERFDDELSLDNLP